jgi:large subunit ribosomal protein L7A
VLEDLRKVKKTVGTKQSLKAVENGTAKTVFIARDADEKITVNLVRLCEKNAIKVVFVDNMKQLGKACGIDVGAAVAALLKDN